MKIEDEYQKNLNALRKDSSLLANYAFDKNAANSNHFERLRLNIAMYNDFKSTDNSIAFYLFEQEIKWRKYAVYDDANHEAIDNLYFSAFVLALFKKPETVWLFWETKQIDFDSSVGVDGEYLCASGIAETYRYLQASKHPKKEEVLDYLGATAAVCYFSETNITDWIQAKHDYFELFNYPITAPMEFLRECNEKERLALALPNWRNTADFTTAESWSRFVGYAEVLGDIDLEITVRVSQLKHENKPYHQNRYLAEGLAKVYHAKGNADAAFAILENLISNTDTSYSIGCSVAILCDMFLSKKYTNTTVQTKILAAILQEKNKHNTYIDGLIAKVELDIQDK